MLPEQPPHFRPPEPSERPWHWALLDAAGEPVEVSHAHAAQRFVTQTDAESWVGEFWADLAAEGVDAVALYELERPVYGPMSLRG